VGGTPGLSSAVLRLAQILCNTRVEHCQAFRSPGKKRPTLMKVPDTRSHPSPPGADGACTAASAE
jgi:hypothetical protein